MSVDIETSIIINASPETVWKIFTDFASYPKWNPFIQYVKGDVAVGKKIKVSIMNMPFKPKVLQYDNQKAFRWAGNLLIPGIFDGAHHFYLEDLGNGTVRFKQGEVFSGILVPLFKKSINTKVKAGYEAMNQKLKQLAEGV